MLYFFSLSNNGHMITLNLTTKYTFELCSRKVCLSDPTEGDLGKLLMIVQSNMCSQNKMN